MKVYILFNTEDGEIIDVFSSEEKAKIYLMNNYSSDYVDDFIDIIVKEVK